MESKQCRRCEEIKPLGLMKKDKRNKDGYSSFCKECHKAASVTWQKAHPERVNATRRKRYFINKEIINNARRQKYDYSKVRWERLRYLYKVSQNWYETRLAEQNGTCAICGKTPEESSRAFSVDHDHRCCHKSPACGKCNRGILCHSCNTSLHLVEKDRNWLQAAVIYLDKYQGE